MLRLSLDAHIQIREVAQPRRQKGARTLAWPFGLGVKIGYNSALGGLQPFAGVPKPRYRKLVQWWSAGSASLLPALQSRRAHWELPFSWFVSLPSF